MDTILPSLDELGVEAGTDKSSMYHNYLSFYERYFAPLRLNKLVLLEIGVFKGASLRTWESYFLNATIVGADIDSNARRFCTERTSIEILDQSNIQQLVDLGVKYRGFDIIIEDGSHRWDHQITTLRTLFPFLKSGGVYIVEDLQTNFGPLAPHYRGTSSLSCVDLLKRLVDLHVADEQIDISSEGDSFLSTYGRAIASLTFFRHACLIEKCSGVRLARYKNPPLVDDESAGSAPSFHILAHIGNLGDVASNGLPHIVSSLADGFIQGFQIDLADDWRGEVEYRGRLVQGVWTEWADIGIFVGARGSSENLTGLSMRFSSAIRSKYDIQLVGSFAGSSDLVTVEGGQDCVALDVTRPLRGFQIIMKEKVATTPRT